MFSIYLSALSPFLYRIALHPYCGTSESFIYHTQPSTQTPHHATRVAHLLESRAADAVDVGRLRLLTQQSGTALLVPMALQARIHAQNARPWLPLSGLSAFTTKY